MGRSRDITSPSALRPLTHDSDFFLPLRISLVFIEAVSVGYNHLKHNKGNGELRKCISV